MRILVCVKQVPAPENRFPFQEKPPGYTDEGLTFRINVYDEYALEEALLLQERFPHASVIAVSVGPERAEAALRRALETGAREAVLLLDPHAPTRDALAIASQLASWAASQAPFDLILTGMMAEDDQRCQTGPLLASLLGIPYATAVVRMEVDPHRGQALVETEREGGLKETVHLPLPALLSVQTSSRPPRYPSLSNKLRARRQPIGRVLLSADQDIPSHFEFLDSALPESLRSTVYLSPVPEEAAQQLVDLLARRQLLA